MPYAVNAMFATAVVTLEDGSQLEEAVAKLDNTKLKDNDVSVSFCASDKLLCVAHLPPRYSDDEFRKLIAQHGQVVFCFIMRSETTGNYVNLCVTECVCVFSCLVYDLRRWKEQMQSEPRNTSLAFVSLSADIIRFSRLTVSFPFLVSWARLFPDASLVKASAPESRSATQVAPLEIPDS